MQMTINSTLYGKQTFFMNGECGYVSRIDEKGKCSQICHGGLHTGSTIVSNEKSFEKTVRKWWRQKLQHEIKTHQRYPQYTPEGTEWVYNNLLKTFPEGSEWVYNNLPKTFQLIRGNNHEPT